MVLPKGSTSLVTVQLLDVITLRACQCDSWGVLRQVAEQGNGVSLVDSAPDVFSVRASKDNGGQWDRRTPRQRQDAAKDIEAKSRIANDRTEQIG